MNVMRLGGVVTLGVLGSFLTIMWARERRRKKQQRGVASSAGGASPNN